MKNSFAVLIIFGALLFVKAELSEEQKQKIKENAKACITETGVDPELVKKARQGEFSNDPKLNDFAFCLSKKLRFQNEAGEIQREFIENKLTEVLESNEKAKALAEKCLVPKSSGPETAAESFKCYYHNTDNHLTLF